MQYREFQLADGCLKLVADCIDSIQPEFLFTYLARHHRHFFAGYRILPGSLPKAQERLREHILQDRLAALPDELTTLLWAATSAELVHVLSEEALQASWRQWRRALGEVVVIGGMLFDEREAVRAIAFAALSEDNHEVPGAAVDAVPALRKTFAPFLRRIQPVTHPQPRVALGLALPGDQPAVSPGHAGTARLRGRVEEDREERSLDPVDAVESMEATRCGRDMPSKAYADKLREAKRALRTLQQERVSDRQALENLGARLAVAETRLADLGRQAAADAALLAQERAQHQELKLAFQARLEAEMHRRLASSLRPWLAPQVQAEQTLQQVKAAGLLDRARGVLDAQHAHDRAFGNRRELRREMTAIRESLNQVEDARRHAIRPLDALLALEAELKTALHALSQALGDTSAAMRHQTLASELALAIHALDSLEAVVDFRAFLAQCLARHLISDADWTLLDQRVRGHALRLNDLAVLHEAERDPLHGGDHAGKARLAIALERPHRLLIDGYNLILAPKVPLAFHEGLDTLIARLCAFSEECPMLDVHVFVDSPQSLRRQASDRVTLHFSGGSGKDRADRDLAAYLAFLSRKEAVAEEVPTTVVSADRAVQHTATLHGAQIMQPVELWAML